MMLKTVLLKRLIEDTSGAFSLMWAVAMTGVLIAIGSTYDLAQISKAKSIAQYAADSMALTASIAVDFDNDDRFVGGQSYAYSAIGGGSDDFTGTMTGSVIYDIDDTEAQNLPVGDPARLLARATVTGTYTPAFMSIVPGIGDLTFTATSDVAYAATEGSPASVFFVVDNSGSMDWDDSEGSDKLDSLEDSMKSFMTTLDGISTGGNNIFRTALYPYSADYNGWYNYIDTDGVIPAKVIAPKWGSLTDGNITQMQTYAGTDSSGAMEDAATALGLEDAVHDAENGEDSPLKFVVFMSDGSNNSSYECATQNVWVPGHAEYWIDTYHGWNDVYYSEKWWFDSWVIYYPASGGGYEDQQTCSTDYWADIQTKASCDTMKADGVTIYTIGYNLEVGYPKENGQTQWYNYVYQSEVTRAQSLLSYCATDSDHYILASSASDLNATFTEIGQEIVREVIRVKR